MAVPERSRVLLYLVDAGGGHRAAARALSTAAEQRGAPLEFEVVSLQQVLDGFDFTRRLTGRSLEESYNELLRRGRTRPMLPMLRCLQWLIARLHRRLARRLATDLASRARAELAVSLAPNFNAPLRDAVHAAWPGVPFAVHLTDWADLPPRFWIVPGLDAVLVGSDAAAEQARSAGIEAGRVVRLSGMVLRPQFHRPLAAGARTAARRELGVADDAFLVLLLVGRKGTARMVPVAEGVLAEPNVWVAAVCGDNAALLSRLRRLAEGSGGRLLPLGDVEDVARLLAASDLLVAKPGPASLAEAFQLGVPVVLAAAAATPQERFNVRVVAERGLGIVVRRWEAIPGAVAALARDRERLRRLRTAVAAFPPNRAVFEALEAYARLAGRPARAEAGVA